MKGARALAPSDHEMEEGEVASASLAAKSLLETGLPNQETALKHTIVQVPLRPGFITTGSQVDVAANYFIISHVSKTRNIEQIFHYDFSVQPPGLSPPVIRGIFTAWQSLFGDQTENVSACFDGKQSVYTAAAYPERLHVADQTSDVVIPQGKGRPPKTYQVKLRLFNAYPTKELYEYLDGKAPLTTSVFTFLTAFDVLFRHTASLSLRIMGRSFYTREGKISMPNGVEVWPGYFQSVRTGQGKLLLNLDVTSSTFLESGHLVEVSAKLLNRTAESTPNLSEHQRQQLDKGFKGYKIRAIHRPESPRTYTIVRLTDRPANSLFFQLNGLEMTVAVYFQTQYGIVLKYPAWPCVVVGDAKDTSKQVFLPMEVCQIIEGQKAVTGFNLKRSKAFHISSLSPPERASRIMEGIKHMKHINNDLLTSFNFAVQPEMIRSRACYLPAPTLEFHPSSRRPLETQLELGCWTMSNHKVIEGVTIRTWAVASFISEHDFNLTLKKEFVKSLVVSLRAVGITVANPDPLMLPPADPNGNVESIIKHAYIKAGEDTQSPPDLLIFLLPSMSPWPYQDIKRVCDTIIGVPSQCVTLKLLRKMPRKCLDSIALKINVKLPGGTNLRMIKELLPFLHERPTMLFGCDVTHPGPGSKSPSIAALVGSMDADTIQYTATTRLQPMRVEIVKDIGSMTIELLRRYYIKNGQKPERLIFYRDGVSEGQFSEVVATEITAIKKCFKALDSDYDPKLTFIIVQKRHHTRLFATGTDCTDPKSKNLLPGIVIDRDITHPFEFDFYLLSHPGLQGLSRPTRYHVLHDENQFTANALAELSYRLCYLYIRTTRSVSIVPPAYYAHVVAARARTHVVKCTDEQYVLQESGFVLAPVKLELEKSMYFM